jgi:hypothetical protein
VLNVPGLVGRLASLDSPRLRVDGDSGIVVILDAQPDLESDRVLETAG